MSTDTGRIAEQKAGEFLENEGFNVVEYNWKRPQCEIDIVAMKNGTVYLVEVKYRKNTNFGSGIDYITKKKLHQMVFASRNWRTINKWRGSINLAAIEVTGDDFRVTKFIDELNLA